MKRAVTRIRGLGYMLWHARHMIYHLLFGATWVWVVYDQFGIYQPGFLLLSLLASVLPDFEHLLFFVTYGKKDSYTTWIKGYIKNKDWRVLVRFMEQGHKYNTKLQYHNVYVLAIMMVCTMLSYLIHWYYVFVFFGAVSIHYWFDVFDDLATLGKLNQNWFRWGRSKNTSDPSIWKKLDKSIDR